MWVVPTIVTLRTRPALARLGSQPRSRGKDKELKLPGGQKIPKTREGLQKYLDKHGDKIRDKNLEKSFEKIPDQYLDKIREKDLDKYRGIGVDQYLDRFRAWLFGS
jgi:hypothetical protein